MAVVVSTRPYGALDLISMLIQQKFTSTERGATEALSFVHHLRPDLVIAVVDPSRFSDLELLRSIARATSALIMVLAPTGESIAAALRAGADLFLRETDAREALEAQLLALRRRMPGGENRVELSEEPLNSGGLTLNVRSRRAQAHGTPLALTNMEFSLLCALVSNAGRILSPIEATRIGTGKLVDEPEANQTVKVYVRRLRQKLEAAGLHSELIVNIRGRGYMWDGGAITRSETA